MSEHDLQKQLDARREQLENLRADYQRLEKAHRDVTTDRASVLAELDRVKQEHKELRNEHERLKLVATSSLVSLGLLRDEIKHLYTSATEGETDTEAWIQDAMTFVQRFAEAFEFASSTLEAPAEAEEAEPAAQPEAPSEG